MSDQIFGAVHAGLPASLPPDVWMAEAFMVVLSFSSRPGKRPFLPMRARPGPRAISLAPSF